MVPRWTRRDPIAYEYFLVFFVFTVNKEINPWLVYIFLHEPSETQFACHVYLYYNGI